MAPANFTGQVFTNAEFDKYLHKAKDSMNKYQSFITFFLALDKNYDTSKGYLCSRSEVSEVTKKKEERRRYGNDIRFLCSIGYESLIC